MWIARLTATFPHTHSPAKSQTFFDFGFNVKTDRSDSNLDWNLLCLQPVPATSAQILCSGRPMAWIIDGLLTDQKLVIAYE